MEGLGFLLLACLLLFLLNVSVYFAFFVKNAKVIEETQRQRPPIVQPRARVRRLPSNVFF